MTRSGRDRDATSETIRDAAVVELLDVGQAEFTMEGVAKGAFYAIGTLYSRWPDREALLADIALERIVPDVCATLRAAPDAASAIDWALGDGRLRVLLLGEVMLAGHTMPEVRPASQQAWVDLVDALAQHMPASMAWYVATYAVGEALLEAIDVRGPDPARGRTRWLVDACAAVPVRGSAPASSATAPDLEVPIVPSPARTDDVTRALIDAARSLLQEQGAGGTSTRDIAAGAGVTTGALYRRYDGKSQLLADVLLTQLQPDRYAWTWELVRALAGDDPLGAAAGVIADRMLSVAQDEPAQRVLLQVGIAARSDAGLRHQIGERISAAHAARVDMVQHFIEAGLIRDDVSAQTLAWGFQTIPVGMRAAVPLGIALDEATVSASMEALLRAAAAR